jgi:hypothetical protein
MDRWIGEDARYGREVGYLNLIWEGLGFIADGARKNLGLRTICHQLLDISLSSRLPPLLKGEYGPSYCDQYDHYQ